ncbi:sensor domain-containing protein [Nocardia otitidiscaviarum]|uniref:sensor domain-containing protein n=1 Tax=Nocardia otitidiscaviarum TaxID=1823 RepID=UPI002456760C|nr:sensor domain-containing protein [Nocardia otitidiscaviarum]
MRGRGIAAAVAVLFLMTGCGQVVGGRAEPDPAVASMPRLGAEQVGEVLLSISEIESIVDTSGLTQSYEAASTATPSETISPARCAALVYTGHDSVYGGDWTALRTRVFRQPGDRYTHFVYQTVVTFRNFLGAEALVDRYRAVIADCRDRNVTVAASGQDSLTWRVADTTRSTPEGRVAVGWTTTEQGNDWICDNLARTTGNTVIEASTCSVGNARAAQVIADRIATEVGRR